MLPRQLAYALVWSQARHRVAPAFAKRNLHDVPAKLDSGHLDVGDGHTLYFQVHGRKESLPMALWLHGGPGAGCTERHAGFCDPNLWRVTLFDQRGCGKSTPEGELEHNTTPDLVEDLEKLRRRVNGDEPWACVIGGSWGSTLALAYAQTYPESVRSMLLRGVCTMRESEIHWLFSPQGGAAQLAPRAWQAFAGLAKDCGDDPDAVLRAYYDMLQSQDKHVRRAAANAWMMWEMVASSASSPSNTTLRKAKGNATKPRDYWAEFQQHLAKSNDTTLKPYPQQLLTCHYSINRGFFDETTAPLSPPNLARIRHIPAIAVQGENDTICPPTTAVELKAAWPDLELNLIPGAGHSQYDPDIQHALVEATDKLARRLRDDPISS